MYVYDVEIRSQAIEAAGAAKIDALQRYHDDSRHLADAKERLAEELASARLTGVIDGKNEADREARARQVLSTHYERLAHAENALNHSREALEVSKVRFEVEELLVRAQEAGR